jgi:uncharacterized protein YdhG (YjbR/CyaY superfamily)
MPRPKPKAVDDYIAGFPPGVQRRLKEIRSIIRKAAPRAEEVMSYGIPAFKLNGPLVYFAGFREHVGLYPVTRVVREKLEKVLAPYTPKDTKATVRFSLDKPIPRTLVSRIVKVRIRENANRRRPQRVR